VPVLNQNFAELTDSAGLHGARINGVLTASQQGVVWLRSTRNRTDAGVEYLVS